jgi:hypothetical protein
MIHKKKYIIIEADSIEMPMLFSEFLEHRSIASGALSIYSQKF